MIATLIAISAENRGVLNSLSIMTVGGVFSAISTWLWVQRNSAIKAREGVQLRLIELEKKAALIDQAVIPISTAFQAILIKELTHFHTPEMDKLMERIGPPNILDEAEEKRLEVLLQERTRDMGPMISDSERDAAIILPIIMKRARVEQAVLTAAEELKIKLVTVAAVVAIPNLKKELAPEEK